MINNKIIVALDYTTCEQAENMIKILDNSIIFYKVGLELFLNSKGYILDILAKYNKKIFLDLKFHDIPNTTKAASTFTANLPSVNMFNVHASGGIEMIKQVASVKRKDQILLAVTVLTSLDNHDIKNLFNTSLSTSKLAKNLALIAKEGGANGIVCSALEANEIKKSCGDNFITVCPGIRLLNSSSSDQKRILTPKEAIQNGADYLVIGRPITSAHSPKDIVLQIIQEIS